MKPNIVFLDEYSVNGSDLSAIEALGHYTGYPTTAPDEVIPRCQGAQIVITNKVIFREDTLKALPDLKLICVAATGTNNIDTEAAQRLGIKVMNAVGYSTHSVTEATIGGAIALLREVVYYDEFVKSGRYANSTKLYNFDHPTRRLYGMNWGIVGLGHIGHEVAKVASVLGCRIAYASVSGVRRDEPYRQMELEELLAWADVLSIHAPLNERTRNLIGREQLANMKPSALIINVARGGIVDEAALAEALDAGKLSGAVLDVFSREPIRTDNPLLHVKDKTKLLLSPHNAWSAAGSIKELVACIAENIRSFLLERHATDSSGQS